MDNGSNFKPSKRGGQLPQLITWMDNSPARYGALTAAQGSDMAASERFLIAARLWDATPYLPLHPPHLPYVSLSTVLSPALILPLPTSLLLFLNHLSSLPFFLLSTPYLHAYGTAQGWRAASGAQTLPFPSSFPPSPPACSSSLFTPPPFSSNPVLLPPFPFSLPSSPLLECVVRASQRAIPLFTL